MVMAVDFLSDIMKFGVCWLNVFFYLLYHILISLDIVCFTLSSLIYSLSLIHYII